MKKRKLIYVIAAVLAISVPLFCAQVQPQVSQQNNNQAVKDLAHINDIVDSISLIEGYYVGKDQPSRDDMYDAAVAGLVNSLNDPYSEFLTKKDLVDFNEDLDGEYVGVGMSIDKKKGEALVVVSPFTGSPAAKVGVRIGDKVIKVDDKDILPLTATETVNLLKGKKGTKVVLQIIREGQNKPLDLTLIRDSIKLEFVESKMLENKVGYVSLLRFGNHTGAEIQKHIKKLQSEGMKGLIFDLRSNPGGSLAESQDISSLFLDEKLIVSLKYKNGSKTDYNRTLPKMGNFPLIVLVNRGSASASEIVTGAIKDYERGTVIGEKTFGKGVVQQVVPLKSGNAVKLTIAQYFTPKGNYIHEVGINPDIEVKMEEVLSIKGYSNDSEQARKNRMEEIKKYLVTEKGEEEANKIIAAGDVQLKRAQEEMNKKLK